MAKFIILCLLSMMASIPAQRITTIQLDGVQYFISRMNPYSPELNYFLAYQYCRSLGLQLASFETNEKVESMSQYLQNAGYSKYDFWTSGNRLGTGMFLWMSTGLPFNATFDYFENSADAVQAGLLDPVDHNSNTSPQRTARDSSSGMEKGCVVMKAPNLKWMPEDCSIVKDFICEQTRCYYYNYGSIPVSSAQGRPIVSTTTRGPPALFTTTTPFPPMMTSTYANLAKNQLKNQGPILTMISSSDDISEPSLASLKLDHEQNLDIEEAQPDNKQPKTGEIKIEHEDSDMIEEHVEDLARNLSNDDNDKDVAAEEEHLDEEASSSEASIESMPSVSRTGSEIPSVEQRLKQISHEIEKLGSGESNNDGEIGRQSFLSLSDLIRTLRPNDKKIPQIDSDYSNTMRVLGETSSMVGADESRKLKIMENVNAAN